MKWYKDSTSRWYALWGFVFGLFIIITATLIEVSDKHLPWSFAAFLDVQLTEPVVRFAYIAPSL